jgi:hypothetical protein
MRNYRRKQLAVAMSLLTFGTATPAALTQTNQDTEIALLEEVIVTGVAKETRKFDATFNINLKLIPVV